MPMPTVFVSRRLRLNGGALALAATLGCAVLIQRPALAQWADCASAPANSKQCVPSGNGNVGIGTTTAAMKLTVVGQYGAPSLSDTTNGILYLASGVTGLAFGSFAVGPYGSWMQTRNDSVGGYSYPLALNPLGGNVGIGTTSPQATLQIGPNSGSNTYTTSLSGDVRLPSWGGGVTYLQARDNSTASIEMQVRTQNQGVLTDVMRLSAGGNVGIGTASPIRKLDVNGTIGAKEVVVTTTGWADYVFDADYKLRPLSEVAAFIKDNGHLPEIPSEAEVKQNGVSMGEMQAKLLAKVEELTLHAIRAEERIKQLEDELRASKLR